MAHKPEVKNQVRADIIQGMSMSQAATNNKVPEPTVRLWKDQAKKNGDDWFLARQARNLSAGTIENLTTEVLEDFVLLWKATIEATKDSKLSPIEKAETLSRLADAYVKTTKAASAHTPTLNKLAVAMDVIKDFTNFTRQNNPDLLPQFLELLEPFGAELSLKYGK